MDKLAESAHQSAWSDGYALRRAVESGSLELAISVLKDADPCVARDGDVCDLALACRMGKADFAKLFRPELQEPTGWRAMAVEKLGATDFWVRWLDDKSSSALAQAAFEAASLGSLECLEAVLPAPGSKWVARMAGASDLASELARLQPKKRL